MTVQWLNESAAQDSTVEVGEDRGISLIEAVPMAELLGLPDALRRVHETGIAEHLSTGLVSTTRGSVALVTSVYRLPDGQLLVLTENAWQPERSVARRDAKRSGYSGR